MVRELNTKGIKTLSNDLGLPTKKIYDFLFYLKQAVSIDNRLLVRKLGVSKNVLNQIKKHMADFLKPVSDQTALNPKGIDLANQILEKSYQAEESIWQNLKGNKNSENIIRILEKYDSARPQPDRNWDQFTATVATTAKRVTLMDFFQDIQEKKVLCLGDDDLVSVAVANLKKSAQVSVLDIDKQLLDAIETISKKENIQVITQAYDARQSLPRNFMGKFDVVFTDPPYTQSGVKLFLSRAIQALDPKNNSGRIYLCYGNSDRAKERFLPIYKILIDSGLMIRWVFDKFNRYQGAESVGSASSLFICDVTPKTRSLVKGEYRESIYANN